MFKNKDKKTKKGLEEKTPLCGEMSFDAKEAYRLLRTNINFTLPDHNGCKVVGVTSSIRGEGKSTVAINLAYTLASTNLKVLLVDMDMRLPSIHEKLNLTNTKGLSDVISGNETLANAMFKHSKYPSWNILLAGTIPPNPTELIDSDAMKNFFKELRESYDYIVVDLPPVNIVTDALAAKDLLDGTAVVVRQNFSDKFSLNTCIRQLTFLNVNILGFVFTDVTGNLKKYGSKYKYKYYKNYKYDSYNKYGYGYYKKETPEIKND